MHILAGFDSFRALDACVVGGLFSRRTDTAGFATPWRTGLCKCGWKRALRAGGGVAGARWAGWGDGGAVKEEIEVEVEVEVTAAACYVSVNLQPR